MQRDAQALRESKELEADDRNRLIGDLGNLLTALEELERLTGVRDNPQVLENWYELLADVLTASFHVGRVAGLLDGAANEREKQTAAMRDAKSKNKKNRDKEDAQNKVLEAFIEQQRKSSLPRNAGKLISKALEKAGVPLSPKRALERLEWLSWNQDIDDKQRAARSGRSHPSEGK